MYGVVGLYFMQCFAVNSSKTKFWIGSLPFDDESISNLFMMIREARYWMPSFLSDDAKDLINRMLQPDPVKRINIKDIKEHPW
jgi:serine/threonine protein kinase